MRKIKRSEGLGIQFGHAGTEGEALTTVQVNIPIDGTKYMDGVNIIECIKERLLPVITVDAITQDLSAPAIIENIFDLIRNPLVVYSSFAAPFYTSYFLSQVDDAALGYVTFTPKPVYT